jgi:2-methylcitrate dehydratase PrpD
VQTIAKQAILDWVGVAFAGCDEPVTQALTQFTVSEGGQPQCGIVGRKERFPASAAAAINGVSSHALDYDDVSFAIPGHATVPVFPAALAVAEDIGASGAQLLEAFIAGYETICRFGVLLAPGHYARGFHATATLGGFGAAAACARLLDFSAATTAQAFGIVATRAAGLKAGFGSSLKPLQAGEAARSGVVAARLAQLGLDTPLDMVAHRIGFARTHSDDMNLEAALGVPRLVSDFSRAPKSTDAEYGYHVETTLFKYHASCYETHAAIECALALAAAPGYRAHDVERIAIRVNPHVDDICNIASPTTPLQAKFSLRRAVAMALLGRETANPVAFSEESLRDSEVAKLQEAAIVSFDADLKVPQTVVRVELRGGTSIEHDYDSSIPAIDLESQQKRLLKKFRALASRRITPPAMDRLQTCILALEKLGGASQLLELTTP